MSETYFDLAHSSTRNNSEFRNINTGLNNVLHVGFAGVISIYMTSEAGNHVPEGGLHDIPVKIAS